MDNEKSVEYDLGAITENAFYGCSKLKTLRFKEGSKLIRIDTGVFTDAIIETVTIPSSVLIIDDNAFANCKKLTNITYKGPQQPAYCSPSAFEESPIKKIDLIQGYPQQEFCGIRLDTLNPTVKNCSEGCATGKCDTTKGVCSQCNDGYFLNGTTCGKCSVMEGCTKCTSSSVCTACDTAKDYALNATSKKCNKNGTTSITIMMMIMMTLFFIF